MNGIVPFDGAIPFFLGLSPGVACGSPCWERKAQTGGKRGCPRLRVDCSKQLQLGWREGIFRSGRRSALQLAGLVFGARGHGWSVFFEKPENRHLDYARTWGVLRRLASRLWRRGGFGVWLGKETSISLSAAAEKSARRSWQFGSEHQAGGLCAGSGKGRLETFALLLFCSLGTPSCSEENSVLAYGNVREESENP